jgi:hypothetical protein
MAFGALLAVLKALGKGAAVAGKGAAKGATAAGKGTLAAGKAVGKGAKSGGSLVKNAPGAYGSSLESLFKSLLGGEGMGAEMGASQLSDFTQGQAMAGLPQVQARTGSAGPILSQFPGTQALGQLKDIGGQIGGLLDVDLFEKLGGAMPEGIKSGEGEPLLQGLFDALGGTKVESTGKLGEIAKAQRASTQGTLGKLRSGGVEGLQSGLKDLALQKAGGGGPSQPKSAGGVTFPTVREPAPYIPEIEPTPLPDRSQLAVLRMQILQEILKDAGGF